VIGSFLDLDNGFCSYYINGCDLGLTVEFEHPNRKSSHHRRSTDASSRSSDLSESTTTTSTLHSITTDSPKTTFSSSSPILTSSSASPHIHDASPTQTKKKRTAKGLGLYPAISLTTHQQALVNFGERPWMYLPPTAAKFRGLNEAGILDGDFNKRVMRWVRKRGVTSHGKSYQPMNKPPLRPRIGADDVQRQQSPESDSTTEVEDEEEEEDFDWDGPLCTICFSEPKDTILLPCKHDGIGGRCAKALTLW
jgi:hypothetical protein